MPCGSKILAYPVKNIILHNLELIQSKKYPNFFFVRNKSPNFAVGHIDYKVKPPAVAVLKLLPSNKQPSNYTPIEWKSDKNTIQNALLRIEILPSHRELVEPEKLPVLVLYSYYPVEINHPRSWWMKKEIVGIKGKHKIVLRGIKSTRSGKHRTEIMVLLVWEPITIKFNITKKIGKKVEKKEEEVRIDVQ